MHTVFKRTLMDSYINRLQTNFNKFLKTKFYVNANQIQILTNPTDFYNHLKFKILHSKDRIFLSSLYLGKNETELVETISKALNSNPNLKVYLLFDGLRSTREKNFSSATLLSNLIAKHDHDRVFVSLYFNPSFNSSIWKDKLIPKRFNEIFGLQHMKFYGFDNDYVMLSGANLSDDYFKNRQDRYYCFQSTGLNNYYFRLHRLVSSLSYKLYPNKNSKTGFNLSWNSETVPEPIALNKRKFLKYSSKLLENFMNQEIKQQDDVKNKDTIVYPISSFVPLFHKYQDKSNEKISIMSIFNTIQKTDNLNWVFTTGYFNPIKSLQRILINSQVSNSHVITASKFANSFYQSRGISKDIPNAYLYLTYKFYKNVERNDKLDQIHIKEWQNGIIHQPNGWSYHAKGVWLLDQISKMPFLTVIGSSNYTNRSYSLDLETNLVLITTDTGLRERMNDEVQNILNYSEDIQLRKLKINNNVKILTSIFNRLL
ncbi:hypothetical protein KAFR_0I02300 [Kazachstania africana CBS 2517]|uniref:CDP-diacylglycerol--glycerol-3-phosphate 3-phosphatidyltransferase n=1 Tax=Kazachstania africana (strain ATCC 22294 / BCRC 22015 / CBS 2517 / CECT 1963 / NBRC 1671 / NRRL Y-8276) TaxID=1071382 RepID=H2B059_KAZAF|nr:hypothetical protein KAFR_0I02300 [Kazachstania africana CBS 2517]CCF60009.1 hypothetical protein KAFR_0I02300 [Kazachstania africana CBS 2517]